MLMKQCENYLQQQPIEITDDQVGYFTSKPVLTRSRGLYLLSTFLCQPLPFYIERNTLNPNP